MIGLIVVGLAVFIFMVIGAVIVMGNLFMILMVFAALSFLAVGLLITVGALWEWYFPSPAKTLISGKRGSRSAELVVDDMGYAELTMSKQYLPEGLIRHKFGWALLPRPIKKFLEDIKIGKPPGRKPKDPKEAREREEKWVEAQKLEYKRKNFENQLAEQIALKKIILKGLNKPLWLQYSGLAANFNPYILVPGEVKQDNPSTYFDEFTESLKEKLSPEIFESVRQKIKTLEEKCENLRVVLDPRRFKEIHPKMFTESQIDTFGRISERIGELRMSGMPMGKILIILVIAVAVIGGLAVAYYLFMNPKPQPPAHLIGSLFRTVWKR